jgi:REP element-mobilizing transposase RayT
LTTAERVECVRTQLLRTATEKAFAVPAGVIMPDHLHLLLEGLAATSEFKRFMTVMRQRAAVAFKQDFGDRLWQNGYHDRVMRNVDEVPGVIRYIERNPVEAGLVEKPEGYPYLWTPR